MARIYGTFRDARPSRARLFNEDGDTTHYQRQGWDPRKTRAENLGECDPFDRPDEEFDPSGRYEDDGRPDPTPSQIAAQQRAAQQLATQGRGGDTEIAHVARGEMVIPQALQNPDVMRAIARAAAARNVPVGRLSVGNARNRINPRTGAPEFSFGPDPEYDPTTGQPRSPDEQQIADLYINRFPKDALGFGHVGIGVNTENSVGFYPRLHDMPVYPGVVKKDDLTDPHDTLIIPTTPQQDAAVQSYINNRQSSPGTYNAWNRQCTDFVAGALRAAGQSVPSDLTPSPWDDKIPNQFFPLLQNRYGY